MSFQSATTHPLLTVTALLGGQVTDIFDADALMRKLRGSAAYDSALVLQGAA